MLRKLLVMASLTLVLCAQAAGSRDTFAGDRPWPSDESLGSPTALFGIDDDYSTFAFRTLPRLAPLDGRNVQREPTWYLIAIGIPLLDAKQGHWSRHDMALDLLPLS